MSVSQAKSVERVSNEVVERRGIVRDYVTGRSRLLGRLEARRAGIARHFM